MSVGVFLDTAAPLARAELERALGPALAHWDRLVGWMGATCGLVGEPLFFGRDSGWSLRFRRSGRALLTLTPMDDASVRALVVIGPSAWEAIGAEPLSPPVRAAWEAAHPYPDGRWLWLTLDDDVAADVERLIGLKSPPPRRPRAAGRTPAG